MALLGLVLATGPALAWHGQGHVKATGVAVEAASHGLPALFAIGRDLICHCSLDPDLFKSTVDSDCLYQAESPEHYFNLEYVADIQLPDDRQAFVGLCLSTGLWYSRVGTLPYATAEWTYRLAIALAEYRRWPEDRAGQAKCQVYAGILAHYAQDMTMPLHCTIHYDGRAGPDGTSPRTGIHARVDALIGKLDTAGPLDPNGLEPFDEVFGGCMDQIQQSAGLVDRVYAMEDRIPGQDEPIPSDGDVQTFAQERLLDAARFTYRLWLTAWHRSAGISLPDWHTR